MDDIKTRTAKAFELASDVSKQLIGLSTATIIFTATFPKEACGELVYQLTWCIKGVLLATWLIHIISIVLGILYLRKLANLLEPTIHENGNKEPSTKDGIAAGLSAWQAILFSIGTILIIIYAINIFVLVPNTPNACCATYHTAPKKSN